MSENILNLPNTITFFRLSLLLPLFYLISAKASWIILFFVSVLLFILDLLDGYLARRLNQITEFGNIFDSFVDKISFITVIISLAFFGYISMKLLVIIGLHPCG